MDQMDSDLLRLVLAALGIALVVAIYLWDRYKRISRRFPRIRMDRNLDEVDFDIPERDDDVGEVRVRQAAGSARAEPMLDRSAEPIPEPELVPDPQPEPQPDPEPVIASKRDSEPATDSEPAIESFSAVEPEPNLSGLGLQLDKAPEPSEQSEPLELTPQDEVLPGGDDQFTLDLEFNAHSEADYLNIDPALMDQVPRLIVQINVMSKDKPFSLAQVRNACAQVDLKYGDMHIYHREMDSGQVLFSMANMVEPGTFPAGQSANFATPGLSLFTQLPNVREGIAIYADMLFTAERLAAMLDAVLKDESRNKLTKQRIEHTREAILEHSRQIQLLRSRH